MLSHVMAMSRPRLFILEAGNSFGLLGDWFAENGLSVNKVSLKPGNGVVLPPFAEAHKALTQPEFSEELKEAEEADETEKQRTTNRGISLGEMEIIAQLMITARSGKSPSCAARTSDSSATPFF